MSIASLSSATSILPAVSRAGQVHSQPKAGTVPQITQPMSPEEIRRTAQAREKAALAGDPAKPGTGQPSGELLKHAQPVVLTATEQAKHLASNLQPGSHGAVDNAGSKVDAMTAKSLASADPTGPQSGPMLTLEGLLAAWGQSNSPYDLNGDGTVGVSDMLMLLGEGGTMPMPEGASEPLTLKGLMGAWGTDNSTFDLNGDGVVDTSDLLLLLSRMGNGNQPKVEQSDLPQNMKIDDLLSQVRSDPHATEQDVLNLLAILDDGEDA